MKNLWLLILALIVVNCSGNKDEKKLATSKGLPCELLVVAEPELLQSDVRDTIETIVRGQIPGLNQAEDYFRSTIISTKGYDRVFTIMHSQLFVTIDKNKQKPMLGIAHDVKARPQIQVHVSAATEDDLKRFLSDNKQKIQQAICDFQLDRMAAIQRGKYSKKVSDDLKAVAGFTICMPTEMIATKKGKRFLWGGTNRNDKDMNFVFYTTPWNGEEINDVNTLATLRDSVMKANIPGRTKDQWMETVWEQGKPVMMAESKKIASKQQTEMRGLWQMRNGALGGPFVALAYIDSAKSRIVVSEGFVYSPRTDKRDLVRTLEAALRTLKIEN